MSKKNSILKIVELIPLLAIVLILHGASKQFSYYYDFNLDIFSYLDIGEFIPQTLFDLIGYTPYAIVAVIITSYFFYHKTNIKTKFKFKSTGDKFELPDTLKTELKKERYEDIKQKLDQGKKSVFWLSVKLLIIVLVGIFFFIDDYQTLTSKEFILSNDLLLTSSKEIGFTIGLSSLISISVYYCFDLFNIRKHRNLKVLISLAIFLGSSGFVEGRIKFFKTTQLHLHSKYKFIVNKEPIISTPTFYYIGKTKNYILFFDEKTNLVTVYPSSQITQYTIDDN